MDIYTKVFLVNLVLLLFAAKADRHLLDDAISKSNAVYIFGAWSLVSLVSIPVFIICIIIKL